MSRPDLIKQLKLKHPKLNNLQLELIIDTFFKSIEDALKEKMNNWGLSFSGFAQDLWSEELLNTDDQSKYISEFKANVERLISINLGLNPIQIIELMSELQVNGGTIISPPLGYFSFNKAKHSKFADDPLFIKTLYFTPSHFDHKYSNSLTFGPEVNLGSFSLSKLITGYRSVSKMLFFIKGNFIRPLKHHIQNDISLG